MNPGSEIVPGLGWPTFWAFPGLKVLHPRKPFPDKLWWFVTFIREQWSHNVLMSSLESCLMNCNPERAEVVKSFSHYLFSPYIFKVKEPCNHANILTKPDPRTFWTNDDSGIIGKIHHCPMIYRKHSAVKSYTKTRCRTNFWFSLFIPSPPLEYTLQSFLKIIQIFFFSS